MTEKDWDKVTNATMKYLANDPAYKKWLEYWQNPEKFHRVLRGETVSLNG